MSCTRILTRFAALGQIGLAFLLAWVIFPAFANAQQTESSSAASLRRQAREFYINGRYDLAADQWEQIAKTNPDANFAAEAYYYAGICYCELKQFDKATKRFQRVVEAYPNFSLSEDAHLNLGWCHLNIADGDVQQYSDAAASLNTLLVKFPNGKHRDEALYFLAESYYHLGKKNEAADSYQRLVEQHRDSKLWRDALYALGVTHEELGQFTEARLAYDTFIKDFPDDDSITEVRLRRAETLLQSGDAEAAEKIFAMVAAVEGFQLADHAMLRQAYSAAQQGKFERAAEVYASLTETFPASAYVTIATIEAALCYDRAQMPEKAVTWLVGAAKAGRKDASEAAHLLCRKYLQDHEPARVLKLAEVLLTTLPDGPFLAHLSLDKADALFASSERRTDAMDEYLRVYESHPEDALAAQALYMAAFTALKLMHYEKVREHGAEFLERFEGGKLIPDVKTLLAECDLAEKKYAEAESAFDALAKDHPEHQEIETWIVRRALCQYEQAKFMQTVETLDSFMAQLKTQDNLTQALFLVGASYLHMNKAAEAAEALSRSLETNPKWSRADETLLFLSLAQRQLGELENATVTIERLIAEIPESSLIAQAHFRLAELVAAARNFPKAIAAYDQVLQDWPQSPFVTSAYFNKGVAEAQSNNYEASALSFKAFIEKDPEHIRIGEARLQLACSLLQLGKHRDAIAEVRILLKSNPSEPHKSDALYLRGLAESGLKDFDAAAATFQAILAANPDYQDSAKVLNELALTYRKLDEPKKAFAAFADLAEKYPDNPVAAEAQFHAAEGHFNAEKFEQAVKSYAAAKQNTKSAEIDEAATHKLGWVFYRQGQFDAALKEFTEQVETHANGRLHAEGLFMKAETLFRLNDFKNAVPAFTASISKPPTAENRQMLAYLHGAQSASRLEQWSEAGKLIDQLLEKFPETPYLSSAVLERGYCKQKLERIDEAIQDYQLAAANSRDETGARARFMMGQIRFSRTDYLGAIKSFQLVMYGYGGQRAPDEIKNWQAKSGFEAGQCAEVQIEKLTGEARSKAIAAARSHFGYVVQNHSSHDLALQAKQRLDALANL